MQEGGEYPPSGEVQLGGGGPCSKAASTLRGKHNFAAAEAYDTGKCIHVWRRVPLMKSNYTWLRVPAPTSEGSVTAEVWGSRHRPLLVRGLILPGPWQVWGSQHSATAGAWADTCRPIRTHVSRARL